MLIILDTFPTSSTGKLPGQRPSELDACREWIVRCEAAGDHVLVPAIAYYEALRELEMRQAVSRVARLRAFCLDPKRFISLTTSDLERAANLWGAVRRAGRPTADPHALDGDVILVAQVIGLGLRTTDYIIATTNPAHISQFAPCDLWTNIKAR